MGEWKNGFGNRQSRIMTSTVILANLASATYNMHLATEDWVVTGLILL
jgi:hypothetical protein